MTTKYYKEKPPFSYFMYYALLYYPKFDTKTEENIEAFRRKYDPFVDSLRPHMPFVFPVPCSEIDEEKLTKHIETVLGKWKPFRIEIKGFKKSWDHWLFLLLKKGSEEATALHDELYTGILSPYLRRDIAYIPHVGIGLFARKDAGYNVLDPRKATFDANMYSQALEEAESMKINSFDTIDRLFLEELIIKADDASMLTSASSNEVTIKTGGSKELKL